MEEELTLLFEGYLQNTLTEVQRKDFEKKLLEDPVFTKDFETYKSIHHFLENKFSEERKELKNTLHNINNKHFLKPKDTSTKTTKVFKLKPWHYSIAASVMLLFGIYMFTFNNSVSYYDYAFSESISLVERNNNNSLYKNAETAFNSKKYGEAINYFSQLLRENPNNTEILFYKGVALVETDNFMAADTVFVKLQETENIYKYKALFYMALSKLKQKDFKASREILRSIPETAEDYSKTKELLKKLKYTTVQEKYK